MLGHLRPGITVKEAEADFTVVAKRLATVVPDGIPETVYGADGVADEIRWWGDSRPTLYIVAGGGGAIAADRLRKRGEPVAGAGDHAGKKSLRIRSALGASRGG